MFHFHFVRIFLSTSFKVDLKFSGMSSPIRAFSQVSPRSNEMLLLQVREEEDLRLLEINKSVAYFEMSWSFSMIKRLTYSLLLLRINFLIS